MEGPEDFHREGFDGLDLIGATGLLELFREHVATL
jgi:hypothetical protein